MNELVNLAEYKQKLQNDLQDANLTDCLLPVVFRRSFSSYRGYSFEYYDYTVKVSSPQGICYIPNQWVYIGALCSQYHSELLRYKNKLIEYGITEDQLRRCHPGRDDNNIPENERSLEFCKSLAEQYLSNYTGDDKNMLLSFLYDYSSWGGGKNISRNDFTVSPVLSIAQSINASSGLIGVIAEALAEKQDIRSNLVKSQEWTWVMNPQSNINKSELIREHAAATFVRSVLQETMKIDSQLSKLMHSSRISIAPNSKKLNIGEFCLGRDTTKLPNRKSDCDSNIKWDYNTKTYYLNLEFNQIDVETKFAPEYNNAYKTQFEICKEGNDFVLYRIELFPTQQIYYGCPGSGKSFKVKDITDKVDQNYVFRTTFHPDTDYASFVGCYKPSTEGGKCANQYKKLSELENEAGIIKNSSRDKVSQIIDFVTRYACDLRHIVATHSEIDSLQDLLKNTFNFNANTYLTCVVDYVLKNQETKITYRFCPQVFTNAYVKAWEDISKPVYLIIEEINRGNCAQIFGDLFQLLDRNKKGYSEYPVKADKDLVDYLKGVLKNGRGIENDSLLLPPNLIIWATMNTSDQSLFPMDSAFKRRWDWEYVPINYDKNIDSGKFIIKLDDDTKYLWVNFLDKVNKEILDKTASEDKQMGNYFIKGDVNVLQFTNKVMFYLWNEVCKEEYGTQRNFFRKGKDVNGNSAKEFSFTDLFKSDNGKNVEQTRIDILKKFMEYLDVIPEPKE